MTLQQLIVAASALFIVEVVNWAFRKKLCVVPPARTRSETLKSLWIQASKEAREILSDFCGRRRDPSGAEKERL